MATRYNYTGGIVTNGLVLNLDAAKTDSYPGTGTTWRDLSGRGNNGTLTNGPTFSGIGKQASIVFDGVDDYIPTTYIMPSQDSTTSFSWNCWVYPTRNNNRDIFMGNRGGNSPINFIKLTSSNFEYYPFNLGGAMSLNQWQNICVVKNLTNFYYYKNGIQTATRSSSVTSSANPFFIGGDNTAGEFAVGRVSNAQIYNTALTAAEITQNFNALRGRYGI